jgi:magnesium chelatase family protein
MFAKINSSHLIGIEALCVDVEVDIKSMGMPSFTVVGLAEGAVKESKERVKASLKNLGYNIFANAITVNLAPADFKKEGTHFDLPIAVGLLNAFGIIDKKLEDTLIIGELSLDAKLRGVNGVLPMVIDAAKSGIRKVILPLENAEEASIVKESEVFGFEDLSEVIAFLSGNLTKERFVTDINDYFKNLQKPELDFADVKGQFFARRAAEIAAAGMHNLLFVGSPGSGKTMIAKRMPSILPPMTVEEAIETTKIHSVAGLIKDKGKLVVHHPFIAPHHTSSDVSIIGGTREVKPGAVSVAHNGILFLDEILEFKRSVLEVLRQPLEDGYVTISRANRTVVYPANFMLVGACNPCPCGNLGDKIKECTCTPHQIQRYRSRLSGPLMDRIDLQVTVTSIDFKDLSDMQPGESSDSISKRVKKATEIQKKRFANEDISYNSQMNESAIRKYCKIHDDALKILESINTKYGLSARAYSKLLKVSRTIADLANSKDIAKNHVLEAVQYRFLEQE